MTGVNFHARIKGLMLMVLRWEGGLCWRGFELWMA